MMKKMGLRWVLMFFAPVMFFASATTVAAQEQIGSRQVQAEIDIKQYKPKIDSLLYGHFIENLFSMFEGGLWAEMLGDRKFFYPVTNKDTLVPRNERAGILGRWRPLGPANAVTADKDRPYTGELSPRVHVVPNERRGIQQDGLTFQAGKEYEGEVTLAATNSLQGNTGPNVQVHLIWGEGANQRHTIDIEDIPSEYNEYPFSFTAGGDTKNGRIEITGTGNGSFLIGVTSLMPADNINGFRPDLLELYREMGMTMLRWGGNFSSGYEWRDGIGDRDKRPPMYDYAWYVVEQNNVGTMEFLDLCRLLGVEPNIGVNSGLGDAWSAAKWVEYVNGSTDTHYGKMRAAHGHPEPYNVEWWGIGNEVYGEWQLGHTLLEHYVIKHNRFAMRMRKVDPSITLVASGASPFEQSMTARHWPPPIPEVPFEFGDDQYDWTGGLLEHSAEHFDYVAEHFYPEGDRAFDVEQQQLVETDEPLVDQVRRAANRVKTTVEAWNTYKEMYPWLKSSDKKIVLDEWNTGLDGLPAALSVATVMNEIFRYTDIFKMSAYTSGIGSVTYNWVDAAMEGTGLVFKLYYNHFEDVPVQVSGNVPQKEVIGTIGVDKPSETSGSDTYPLDVMASVSPDRSTLTITVVNPTEAEQQLDLAIAGADLTGQAQKWTITGPSAEAENDIEEGLPVTLEERPPADLASTVAVEPLSVNLYKVSIQELD